MTEQYAWRFTEARTGSDAIVVAGGGQQFWETYGDMITIVTWDLADLDALEADT